MNSIAYRSFQFSCGWRSFLAGVVGRVDLDADLMAKWPAQLAGVTWFQKAHGIAVTLETYGRKIKAAVAQQALGGGALATQLANRAGVEAGAALAALLARHTEGTGHIAAFATAGKADGSGHHLLGANPHAQPALDAVGFGIPGRAGLAVHGVAALADAILGGQILDALRLRAGGDIKLQQKPARPLHPP